MSLVRLLARPMLSAMFLVGGYNSLRNPEGPAQRAQPVLDRVKPMVDRVAANAPFELDHPTLVRINGAVHVAAGLALATGRWPRLSASILAGTLVPTTFGGHRFWEEDDPGNRTNQMIHFTKNVTMMGGLLLAAVDTEGRPSLAWRARNQAKRARKRAGDLTS